MPTVLMILTSKQHEDVVALGGTGWWKVDPVKVRRVSHVILTHNAYDRRRPGDPERHGQSFMIATIRDVLQDEDGRWLIQFDEFADTDSGVRWPGHRNPVTYTDGDEMLGQLSVGEWQPMQHVDLEDAQALRRRDDASVARMKSRGDATQVDDQSPVEGLSFGQIIDHHRKQLARDLGVDPAAVRISIEVS